MTPKEKAIELRNKFRLFQGVGKDADGEPVNNYLASKHNAKQCALIAAEEILNACNDVYNSDMVHFKETGDGEFWQQVKTEIEKL